MNDASICIFLAVALDLTSIPLATLALAAIALYLEAPALAFCMFLFLSDPPLALLSRPTLSNISVFMVVPDAP
jgi:hypothetical protein